MLVPKGLIATVGGVAPPGLVHVVLDNGTYKSTGGQLSTLSTVDWSSLGAAAGYRSTAVGTDAAALRAALDALDGVPGPHLVVADERRLAEPAQVLAHEKRSDEGRRRTRAPRGATEEAL